MSLFLDIEVGSLSSGRKSCRVRLECENIPKDGDGRRCKLAPELWNMSPTGRGLVRGPNGSFQASTSHLDLLTIQARGQALFDGLLDDEGRGLFYGQLAAALNQGDGRLRLRFAVGAEADPALYQIPWEAVFDSKQRFLATHADTPLFRVLNSDMISKVPPPKPPPLNMLIAVANPEGNLDVSAELTDMDRRIEAVQKAASTNLRIVEVYKRTQLADLRDALATVHPDILHFIGHGGFSGNEGHLRLHDETDSSVAAPIGAQAFAELLKNDPPRLVVLNSCQGGAADDVNPFGGVAQSLIRYGVPNVVAMQYPISDRAAVAFSTAFYGAIAEGHPVDVAINLGRHAIQTTPGVAHELITPVLYSTGASSSRDLLDVKSAPPESPAPPPPADAPITPIADPSPKDQATVQPSSDTPAPEPLRWVPLWMGGLAVGVAVAALIGIGLVSSRWNTSADLESWPEEGRRPASDPADSRLAEPEAATPVDALVPSPSQSSADGRHQAGRRRGPVPTAYATTKPNTPHLAGPTYPDEWGGGVGGGSLGNEHQTEAESIAPQPGGRFPAGIAESVGSSGWTSRFGSNFVSAWGGYSSLIIRLPTVETAGGADSFDWVQPVPEAGGAINRSIAPPTPLTLAFVPESSVLQDDLGLLGWAWPITSGADQSLGVRVTAQSDPKTRAIDRQPLALARATALSQWLIDEGVALDRQSIVLESPSRFQDAGESGTVRLEAIVLGSARVLFSFDETEVSEVGQVPIDRTADWLLAHPSTGVILRGRADDIGPEGLNMVISERRALAVAEALMARGVDRARLTMEAIGEDPNLLDQPRSERRRVEMVIVPLASTTSRAETLVEVAPSE